MVRKTITLSEREQQRLKRAVRESRMPESALIRRGIESALRTRTLRLDEAAWRRELRFIKSRAHITGMTKSRAWSREELYDERLSRISH